MQTRKKASNRRQPVGLKGPVNPKRANKPPANKKLRQSVSGASLGRAGAVAKNSPLPTRFSVAPNASDINPDEIVLSARLRGALSQLGVRRLGDLNVIEVKEFLECRNCGRRSLRELETVLQRAAAGYYAVPADTSGLAPAETIRVLDASLASLPARDRDCLIKRFGGRTEQTFTLDRIGRPYHLTRERVRQSINGILTHIRLLLGPAGRLRHQHLLKLCREQVVPVTPGLIARWLPDPWPLSLRPAFYARLMAAIWPELPVWTGDEPPAPWIDGRTETLLQTVRTVVEAAGGKLALKDAFSRVTANSKYHNLSPEEFLVALRSASHAGLKVDLENPEMPQVAPA